ncbi:hypothetical protein SAMN06295879_3433 [Agreia bicolorata]|uniref:Uncharacterized protein n=1 Tax=Agreia bicolorata TaxID=110935 RepID=A0A1T4YK13_9MICO|nr:hypothetical protein SAMN06295879_3433 [Agreia bicolorata]
MYAHHDRYVCSRRAERVEKVTKHTVIRKHLTEARTTNEIVAGFSLGQAETVPEATLVNLGKWTTDRQEMQAQRARIDAYYAPTQRGV